MARSTDFHKNQKKVSDILDDVSVAASTSPKEIRKSYRLLTKEKKPKAQAILGQIWMEGKIRFEVQTGIETAYKISNTEALGKLTTETMGYVGRMHTGVAKEVIKEIEHGIREGLPHKSVANAVGEKIRKIADGDVISIRTSTGKTMKTTVRNYSDLLTKQATNVAYDRGHSEAALESGLVEKKAYRICAFGNNTCEACASQHGELVDVDADITLHPRCDCSKEFRFDPKSGVKSIHTPADLQREKDVFFQKYGKPKTGEAKIKWDIEKSPYKDKVKWVHANKIKPSFGLIQKKPFTLRELESEWLEKPVGGEYKFLPLIGKPHPSRKGGIMLTDGRHRYLYAKQRGYKTFPVVVWD